jgi:hypothetical protein
MICGMALATAVAPCSTDSEFRRDPGRGISSHEGRFGSDFPESAEAENSLFSESVESFFGLLGSIL